MIQRIQTLYSLITIVALIASAFFPYALIVNTDGVPSDLMINGLFTGEEKIGEVSVVGGISLTVLSVLLSVIGLVFYKKRKQQMLAGRVNYLILLVHLILILFTANGFKDTETFEEVHPYFGFYFIIVAIIMTFLANRAIKKDEELIKSIDRIR